MTAAQLLQALRQRGVILFVVDRSLKYRAATPGAYTDEDRIAVAAVRFELLRLLAPAESIDQPVDPEWDEARASQTVDDLIALRDAIGRSEGYALRQVQNAAADEVDRCWLARDAEGLRRAANVFAASFIAFESAIYPSAFKCDTPTTGRTVQPVPPWNETEGKRIFDELSREVEMIRRKFGGRQPLATLLTDALAIASRFLRDREAEAARGWDALELLRGMVPIVRECVENTRKMHETSLKRSG